VPFETLFSSHETLPLILAALIRVAFVLDFGIRVKSSTSTYISHYCTVHTVQGNTYVEGLSIEDLHAVLLQGLFLKQEKLLFSF
jgi:hypothetical protein